VFLNIFPGRRIRKILNGLDRQIFGRHVKRIRLRSRSGKQIWPDIGSPRSTTRMR
jgi:hypothetical protein